MASIIIADENEGRRNLLANTFERNGYDVTRLSTLAQAEATAAVVLPNVLLLEGEWMQGSALDTCQRLSGHPKFRTTTRTVVLSRTTAPDYLASAAMAGVAEVIGKPVDMNQLISQIQRHASKQFVAPPAEVAASAGGGFGAPRFDVGMTMNDSEWALPMLRRLVESGNIDDEFVASLREQMAEEGQATEEEERVSSATMAEMLRLALNRLVGSEEGSQITQATPTLSKAETQNGATNTAPSFNDLSKGATLGEAPTPSSPGLGLKSSMEDILERQAEDIAKEVEGAMEEILSEEPEYIALLPEAEKVGLDPETVELTRLSAEVFLELMTSLQRPGALSDLTLLTQIEDAERLASDVLDALPTKEEEE